jgi:hypothetical protein
MYACIYKKRRIVSSLSSSSFFFPLLLKPIQRFVPGLRSLHIVTQDGTLLRQLVSPILSSLHVVSYTL